MINHAIRMDSIEEVIEMHSKKVKNLAWMLSNSNRYDKWLRDDLTQQGYVGLLEAYRRYDPTGGINNFWRYAKKSVRGRMIEFKSQYYSFFKPSKQIKRVMRQIHDCNLYDKSPQVISETCSCSLLIAFEALYLYRIQRPIYLNQPVFFENDPHETELLDLIGTQDKPDNDLLDIFQDLTDAEKKVFEMFIEGYRRENIIEHTRMSPIELKKIIDMILEKYGFDAETILNRNEERLMKMASISADSQFVPPAKVDSLSNFDWIDINKITSSPNNPRMDLKTNSQDMQKIIEDKGWEETITCYKRNAYYFILSGHRRWQAAKDLGETHLPVFIVAEPRNQADELERLGSLQSGQVAWTPYEVAKNTHDRWLYSGGSSYSELAKKLGITSHQVCARIIVYKYYLKDEIAEKLANGMYSITMLYYIAQWIKRLINYQPKLVEGLTEEYVRRQMLKKFENKCFNSNLVNDKAFVSVATEKQLFEFISDAQKTLKQCQIEVTFNERNKHYLSPKVNILIQDSSSSLKGLLWNDHKEALQLMNDLNHLLLCLEEKAKTLEEGVAI